VKKNPSFILKICPEVGLDLDAPNARRSLAFSPESGEQSRLCDYSGLLYCSHCHWLDEMSILARIVHNWDFTPRPVKIFCF